MWLIAVYKFCGNLSVHPILQFIWYKLDIFLDWQCVWNCLRFRDYSKVKTKTYDTEYCMTRQYQNIRVLFVFTVLRDLHDLKASVWFRKSSVTKYKQLLLSSFIHPSPRLQPASTKTQEQSSEGWRSLEQKIMIQSIHERQWNSTKVHWL